MIVTPVSKRQIADRVAAAERGVEVARVHLANAEARLAEARQMKPVSAPRIDKLEPGAHVRLYFTSTYGNQEREEDAVFVGITGDGDDREATFRQPDSDSEPFEWQSYRYDGYWAYGSSAERLVLVEVFTPEEVAAR